MKFINKKEVEAEYAELLELLYGYGIISKRNNSILCFDDCGLVIGDLDGKYDDGTHKGTNEFYYTLTKINSETAKEMLSNVFDVKDEDQIFQAMYHLIDWESLTKCQISAFIKSILKDCYYDEYTIMNESNDIMILKYPH